MARLSRNPAATVPLGSLTQVGSRDGANCAACGSDRVTRLSMSLTDGTAVDFTSCHRCEHKTWSDAERELSVAEVLGKARKEK